MFRFGVIDRAQLVRGYLDIGYSPEDAAHLADFAQAEKMGTERDLTKAEILSLFKSGEIDRTEAESQLTAQGYDEHERGWILDLAEYQKAKVYRDAVMAVVHRRYVEREVDEPVARERLSKIGIPAEAQDRNVELWDFERATNPTHLTEAQMRKAWRKGLVNEGQYRALLTIRGYVPADADILVALYRPSS